MTPHRAPSKVIPAAKIKAVIADTVKRSKHKDGYITAAEVVGPERSFDAQAAACRRAIILRLRKDFPRAASAELARAVGLPSTCTYVYRVLAAAKATKSSD